MDIKILKTARIENKYTQKKLAKLLNISIRHYQRLELGECNPSLDLALRLRDILGTSLDDLFPRQP